MPTFEMVSHGVLATPASPLSRKSISLKDFLHLYRAVLTYQEYADVALAVLTKFQASGKSQFYLDTRGCKPCQISSSLFVFLRDRSFPGFLENLVVESDYQFQTNIISEILLSRPADSWSDLLLPRSNLAPESVVETWGDCKTWGDYYEETISLDKGSYMIAPFGSKSANFDWRMTLKVGDLVDCEDHYGGWYCSTVLARSFLTC